MTHFHWSKGNSKLNKTAKLWEQSFGAPARFASFNIPQFKSITGKTTCPYAGICADVCYAGQGRLAMPMAIKPREENLEKILALTPAKLAKTLMSDVSSMRTITHIRLHDSGDFFSRPYYHAWLAVAGRFSDITFYAYTKSIPFLNWDKHPENFRVTQSLGGRRDYDIDYRKPHAKIFASEHERVDAGYCDGNESDIPAIIGETKIGLVYHGVRNLTETNLVQIRAA